MLIERKYKMRTAPRKDWGLREEWVRETISHWCKGKMRKRVRWKFYFSKDTERQEEGGWKGKLEYVVCVWKKNEQQFEALLKYLKQGYFLLVSWFPAPFQVTQQPLDGTAEKTKPNKTWKMEMDLKFTYNKVKYWFD